MCDEFTAADVAAAGKLTRRTFTAIGGAAAMVATAPSSAAGSGHPGPGLIEAMVAIPTANGTADAFFVHPSGRAHPGIVLWPDIAGLRDAFKVMARRLAGAGYAVLVVNQYYRSARAPVLASFAEWRTPAGQEKLKPMIAALTSPGIASDGAAFVHWLDQHAAVDHESKIATSGYCMGGPFAMRTAAAAPARVGAVATFHGASLVTDKPDSPHLTIKSTHARYLLAIARGDDARAPGDKDALRAAAAAAHRPAEIEVYPAEHGWCVIDSPSYDQAQAERAWSRLQVLLAQL